MNNPFIAKNVNVSDEAAFSSEPAAIGNNNVIVSQGQQRRVCDTVTTSVQGYPRLNIQNNQLPNNYAANYYPYNFVSSQFAQPQQNYPPMQAQGSYPYTTFLQAQAQSAAGGVTFTFTPPLAHPSAFGNLLSNNAPTILDQYRYNEPYTNQQNVQQPLTLHQQIALKAIEKNVLEAMLLEEQYKRNPFQLQFHRDMETSTDTLFTGLETKDRSVDNICNESDGHKKPRTLKLKMTPKIYEYKHVVIDIEDNTVNTEEKNSCDATTSQRKICFDEESLSSECNPADIEEECHASDTDEATESIASSSEPLDDSRNK